MQIQATQRMHVQFAYILWPGRDSLIGQIGLAQLFGGRSMTIWGEESEERGRFLIENLEET